MDAVGAQDDLDWVKLNAQQTGFYRVQYPQELWGRLTRVAGRVSAGVPILPPVDLAGLLDDAWALNLAGALPIHVFLNLTRSAPAAALSVMHGACTVTAWQPA